MTKFVGQCPNCGWTFMEGEPLICPRCTDRTRQEQSSNDSTESDGQDEDGD